jgi:Flp pilus assembly protein TadG
LQERTSKTGGQEGQSMVETALMILAVLLLLMGIIEFGSLFYAYVRVSNATREGARAGSLFLSRPEENLCDAVSHAVQAEFADIQLEDIIIEVDGATMTVEDDSPPSCNPAPPELGSGGAITVTVSYDFPLPVVTAFPIIRDIIPSPYRVARTVAMRFQ